VFPEHTPPSEIAQARAVTATFQAGHASSILVTRSRAKALVGAFFGMAEIMEVDSSRQAGLDNDLAPVHRPGKLLRPSNSPSGPQDQLIASSRELNQIGLDHVHDHRRQRNSAHAAGRLRWTRHSASILSLAELPRDRNSSPFQVEVITSATGMTSGRRGQIAAKCTSGNRLYQQFFGVALDLPPIASARATKRRDGGVYAQPDRRDRGPDRKDRARWMTPWKPALNAVKITFEGPISIR
jgi:hypothetical protein